MTRINTRYFATAVNTVSSDYKTVWIGIFTDYIDEKDREAAKSRCITGDKIFTFKLMTKYGHQESDFTVKKETSELQEIIDWLNSLELIYCSHVDNPDEVGFTKKQAEKIKKDIYAAIKKKNTDKLLKTIISK